VGFPWPYSRRDQPAQNGEWPCRHAAEQRDELATPDHSITSSARASGVSLSDRSVDLMSAWKLPPTDDIFDARYGRW
jgi:hypothetical protein